MTLHLPHETRKRTTCMTQSSPQLVAAREVLWTYRGANEDALEQDYYSAMAKAVTAEIEHRLRPGTRIWVGREMHLRLGDHTIQARLTNIEPLLAAVVGDTTRTIAQYRARMKDEGDDVSTFLAEVIRYPTESLGALYESLVGLDEIKRDMYRKLTLLISPHYVDSWASRFYGPTPPKELLQVLRDRKPLIILEGEVGSGKTALARSIGERLSQALQLPLALFIVNSQVRGGGHVGELTKNIARAFAEAERCHEREQIPVLILIDEADALAQARGSGQAHHEDDAGVNTLIQRIDRLAERPMAVIFATNFSQALDSAILRRAVATYHFSRPNMAQRAELFRHVLGGMFTEDEIVQMARATSAKQLPGLGSVEHSYTYSDLTQRILPSAVEQAIWAKEQLSLNTILQACSTVLPTPETAHGRQREPENMTP